MFGVDAVGMLYFAAGAASLAAALLPRLLGRAPISMPMVFLAVGILAFTVLPDLPDPDPIEHNSIALHLTELCVVISLMGAGLALDRPAGWRRWGSTWRLLAITMPLTIVAVTVIGHQLLGLGLAAAVLVAAVLAPTDPVLASEVQVAEPADDADQPTEDEARFALTSEAGLNDGLAFPFTYAAIALSAAGAVTLGGLTHWLAVDVGWRLGVGVGVGIAVGWLLRRLFFHAPMPSMRLADHAEGFVALAATLLAYGAAEMVEGYGFIAVFVCACVVRAGERSHGYHKVLHQYIESIERLLTVAILILLGGAIARGLLDALHAADVVAVAVFLLMIRPLTGWLGLAGGTTGRRERLVIAFFGVRGIGSLFYIAYAAKEGEFADLERLWAIVGLAVTASVVLHGVTATPVMRLLDRRRQAVALRRFGTRAKAPETDV